MVFISKVIVRVINSSVPSPFFALTIQLYAVSLIGFAAWENSPEAVTPTRTAISASFNPT